MTKTTTSIKSLADAYILLILFGAHYAYLDKWKLQIIFWLTGGGLGIWWVISFFTLPAKVKHYNKYLIRILGIY